MAERRKILKRRTPPARPRSAQPAYFSRDALCSLSGITDDQLELWEFEELVAHSRVLDVDGRPERVYDQLTLRRIRTIRSLGEDLGVNLEGIGVILHLLDQLSSR
jgi:DNA-binding transcriptional MerR regulator